MSDLALVLVLAGGTFLMRTSLVTLLASVAIPGEVEVALRLVVPAVLAGLAAQTLFLEAGEATPLGSWYAAAAIAAAVAWKTRSVGWTLLVGMVAVWILEALAGLA